MLRKIDHAKRMARFYQVEVRLTLFGEWTVRREWGRIGGASRAMAQTVATQEEAREIARAKLAEKIRRSYTLIG